MPHWYDVPPEDFKDYGNGCGLRRIPVPSFAFRASCRIHDFNFERGSGTWWKAPYYYTKANWDFYTHMLASSSKWWHSPVATVYFVAVQLLSWPFFTVGRWRTVEEILLRDKQAKKGLL